MNNSARKEAAPAPMTAKASARWKAASLKRPHDTVYPRRLSTRTRELPYSDAGA